MDAGPASTAGDSIRALIRARKREGSSLNALRDIRFLKRQLRFTPGEKRTGACYSGTHSLYMDPWGTIYPCVMLDRPMGNAAGQTLDEIWFGEKARQVRNRIREKTCNCLTECETFLTMQRDPKEIFGALAEAFKGDKS